ncbi:MAG TPA: flagellar basal body rod protein FlgB [Pirellulales bacterium]|jgi:flagellar basal-body rod protein FlgB|nr:flagellar basal body rod protein FlgB [Pirellulales bacterium]
MLNSLLNTSAIPALEEVLNFTEARHQVLAGNIANIDTPGYRTRDLDGRMFESQLKDAIRSRDRSHGAESSLGAAPSVGHFEHVRDNLKAIVYHDQTNVGIEQQAIEISKNQIQHNIATTILASQFQLLGAAVSERA